MPMFRKKPVVIEARQFDGTFKGWMAISEWIGKGLLETAWTREHVDERAINIPTLEGKHTALPGDWIIKGIRGEFYPCKPDIFAATYEPADAASRSAPPETTPRETLGTCSSQVGERPHTRCPDCVGWEPCPEPPVPSAPPAQGDAGNPWPPMDEHGSHSPLAETIREEMAARGWTEEWVMEQLGDPVEAVAFQLLLAAHHDHTRLSTDSAEKLGRVFGVSPALFLNLDATTQRIGYAMAPAPAQGDRGTKPGQRRPVQTSWDDNCPHCRSPFRAVLWRPLVRCTGCGEMYRLPPAPTPTPDTGAKETT